LLKGAGSNFVPGKSRYFVAEACEYKKSFLNLYPDIAVITNIDNDHLDYYKNIKNIQKAFREFANRLGEGGYLVCNPKSPRLNPVIKNAKYKIIDYSKFPRDLNLKIPGSHNLDNAQAALAVAEILKIKRPVAKKSLESFSGTWRRFEYKGKTKSGALVYDDYAHHPTEIKATLAGAREVFSGKRIFCIFQPHLYSRTKLLAKDFSESFGDADAVAIAEIYAARETDPGNVSSADLVKKISSRHGNVMRADTFAVAADFVTRNAEKGDVIFTMGAGDIHKVGELLCE
jgi:UDP-N-acetylmuramate--alanine ligase